MTDPSTPSTASTGAAGSAPAGVASPIARTRHRGVLWAGFLVVALFLGALWVSRD